MLRALRSEKGYIKGFLENQWRSWKHEDVGYQAAYLARLRQKQLNFIELHNKLPNESIYHIQNLKLTLTNFIR